MKRDILLRNDERDERRKSFWVYRNLERSLAALAREEHRDLNRQFDIGRYCQRRSGTAYRSFQTVIALGLRAHEELSHIAKKSLIYLDPGADDSGRMDLRRLAPCGGRAGANSTVVTVGRRARAAAHLLPAGQVKHYDLPPLDLSPSDEEIPDGKLRVTVVNHLQDETLARSLVASFIDRSEFLIDCYGLETQLRDNRVRHLTDGEVGEGVGFVHVHIGRHGAASERLRVCDSWQSHVPVLLVDVPADRKLAGPAIDVRAEHDALLCHDYEDICGYIGLLLGSPSLRRLLLANGRNALRSASLSWGEIVQDLTA